MTGTASKNTVTTVAKIAKRSDIETVCWLERGWGTAFKRLCELAGYSQTQLAELVGCNQSAIAHWEREDDKPRLETLRKALIELGADPRTLFKFFELPPEITAILNSQTDPEQCAIAIGQILLEAGSNEDALKGIFDLMSPKIMAALSIKAPRDVQAAKLYFEREDRFKADQAPKRRAAIATDITPSTQFLPAVRRTSDFVGLCPPRRKKSNDYPTGSRANTKNPIVIMIATAPLIKIRASS